ncbi:MAG TPA: pilus assembly protein PilM [Phycisphaerae bacterium]|jgi:Tfp pilus assembly PilM family ATPase
MLKLFDSGLCPIGIDAGSHAVHMTQFRAAGAGLKLQAACRIELDSLEGGEAGGAGGSGGGGVQGVSRITAAVKHALANEEFVGKEVVLSLPASCMNAKSVRLPQMPDSDLSQALHWEAKDRFGFEVGDGAAAGMAVGQLVWFRGGEVRRGTEVKDEILLFAVEGGVLTDYIQSLAGLGLKLRAVDIAPCAVHRSLRRGGRDGTSSNMLRAYLDLGHVGAQFFITRGEELVFYKHIDIGGKTINEAVAAKLGITVPEALQMRTRIMTPHDSLRDAGEPGADDAAALSQAVQDATRAPLEELARELDMCMRYYVVTFRDARPEIISIAGRQAAFAHVRENLAATLGLQVEEAQPLRGVAELGDAARPDRSGEWAVAAGLSLYPLKGRLRAGVAA